MVFEVYMKLYFPYLKFAIFLSIICINMFSSLQIQYQLDKKFNLEQMALTGMASKYMSSLIMSVDTGDWAV